MTESDTPTSTINAHVEQVAALLPFPVELDADMGGTFALQIDLGQRGGVDDPHDTAGIDPDNPHWWIDIEGGENTSISDFGLNADPAVVASWIARTALAAGCPATTASRLGRRDAIAAASNPMLIGVAISVGPDNTRAASNARDADHRR